MMKQQFSNPVNILVSYAYWCKELEEAFKRTPNLCLLIDSGAYTAYKLGKVFTVDEYCSFIDHLPVKPYGYFSLDVIGNPKETMNNYLYMIKRGYNPIPIFTRGASENDFKTYSETSDYIGIGGLVGTPKPLNFVEYLYRNLIKKERIHLLGLSSINTLLRYKPHSCDTSMMQLAIKFGGLRLYTGKGTFEKLSIQDIKVKRPNKNIINGLQDYLDDWKVLKDVNNWVKGNSVKYPIYVSHRSFFRYMFEVEEKMKTKVFAAVVHNNKNVLVDSVYQELIYANS